MPVFVVVLIAVAVLEILFTCCAITYLISPKDDDGIGKCHLVFISLAETRND